ncbi:MAG TPA: hypothetical protein VKU77_39250 [Streptosporangiaceae bacterium]|nr:hypothetical protein [Streptosporangiaceae bacterium]
MLLTIILLLFVAAASLGIFRAILRGTLTLDRVDERPGTVHLPASPWRFESTDGLIAVPGRIYIVGIPFTHRMHIWIRSPGRPMGAGTLRWGGQRYISGVWVTHDAALSKNDLPDDIDLDSAEL